LKYSNQHASEDGSQLSRVAVKSLEDAIQNFNTKVPCHKSEAIVDKRTKFAALVKAAQKELVDHCSEEVAVKGHRKLAWRKVKHALEKFCKTIYAYSAVMDVLVSSHPEIASLACRSSPKSSLTINLV